MSGTANLSCLNPGDQLWVRDPDPGQVWSKVDFEKVDEKMVTVKFRDGSNRQIAVKEQFLLTNTEIWSSADGLCGVNDLVVLTHLHEPEVLQGIQLRFDIDQIYTFCGPILIAVNPFKMIKNLYSQKMLEDYINNREIKNHPHIWTVSKRAFMSMTRAMTPQAVLISGESGAGKTETMKHVLKFLTEAMSSGDTAKPQDPNEESTEKRVMNSNPLLEAFGNACTTRNRNSSRFGKFIELQFMPKGSSASFDKAAIDVYLLEKVRITEIHANERTYHIFYQACAASARLKKEDCNNVCIDEFKEPQHYEYLSKNSSRFVLERTDDAEEFMDVIRSMNSLGISVEEQQGTVEIICAVLHCGNIKFAGGDAAEVAKGDDGAFDTVVRLLNVDGPGLAKAMTHKLIVTPGEKFESPLNDKISMERRDALARIIYGYLFLHLVKHVNNSLAQGGSAGNSGLFIGVLDIFGFEHFEVNSFEQLCINFANERLQKIFNDFVFKMEMELYKEEGIPCDDIEFPDNADIIEVVAGKKGSIFALLDEEGRLPKGTDQGFCNKIAKELAKHTRIAINPVKKECFIVIHFAGPVAYDTRGFMDKNKDELGDLLKNTLAESRSPFVANLMQYGEKPESAPAAGGLGGPVKKATISSEFKGQLESLVAKLSLAGPNFVRCLKPNADLRPDTFNRQSVVEQLRSGGVIEALHVQRAGYPCRAKLAQCWREVCILFSTRQRETYDAENISTRLAKVMSVLQDRLGFPKTKSGAHTWAVGKTTVFYKQDTFELLEAALTKIKSKAANLIRSVWRTIRFRRLFTFIRNNVVMIQANYRGFHVRRAIWEEEQQRESEEGKEGARRRKSIEAKEVQAAEASAAQASAEAERLKQEMADEQARLLEEERLIEEQRLFKEKEEARKRAEEEQRRIEEQRRKEEEERKKAEETRLRLEESERAAKEFEEKAKRMAEEQELKRQEVEAEAKAKEVELQKMRQQAEDLEQQHKQELQMAQIKAQAVQAGQDELTKKIQRLEADLKQVREEAEDSIKGSEESHRRALDAKDEQLESQRSEHTKQMSESRSHLEDMQNSQAEAQKKREGDTSAKFDGEIQRMRDREETVKKRHEDEVASLRARQEEQSAMWQQQMMRQSVAQADTSTDKEMLERQIEDLKSDHESEKKVLQNQTEDTKRMFQTQMDMNDMRAAEREKQMQHEIDDMKKRLEKQGSTLQQQMDFQKQELTASSQQEVELVRRQGEMREKSLMSMVEQARAEGLESQKTKEASLVLKQQQQEEFQRCADARTRHLEASATQQQELYDMHIAHLTKQLKDCQEQARGQLEEASRQSDRASAGALEQIKGLEQQLKADQERVMATAMEAAKVDTTMLQDQLSSLERANEGLQRKYEESKRSLARLMEKTGQTIDIFEKNEGEGAKKKENFTGRRHTIGPGTTKGVKGAAAIMTNSTLVDRKRQQSVRWAMMPDGLAEESATAGDASQGGGAGRTARSATISAFTGGLRKSTAFAGLGAKALPSSKGGPRGTIMDLKAGLGKRKVAAVAPVSIGSRLLRPSLRQGGRALVGDVGPWRELAADSAVTIIRFADVKPESESVKMAIASRSGIVTVYEIRRTGLERGVNTEADDAGLDPQLKLSFQSHAKAVTFMCFGAEDHELLTTSTDWTVRLWSLEDGKLLYELVDASLVICAVPVSRPAGGIIVANTNAVLRFVDRESVRQKVRMDYYARTLALGLGGTRLLAGSSRGSISSFSVNEDGLQLMSKLDIGRAAVTCLTICPCDDGAPPLVAANSMDCTVCLLQANPQLTNFTVLRRIPNPHKLLPLRSCHVSTPGGAGFCVTGSEDAAVRAFDLDKFTEHRLPSHSVPVVDCAATTDSMMLCSGDVRGRVILWRRGCDKATS